MSQSWRNINRTCIRDASTICQKLIIRILSFKKSDGRLRERKEKFYFFFSNNEVKKKKKIYISHVFGSKITDKNLLFNKVKHGIFYFKLILICFHIRNIPVLRI